MCVFGQPPADDGSDGSDHLCADDTYDDGDVDCDNDHDDDDDADIRGDSKCNDVEVADRDCTDNRGDCELARPGGFVLANHRLMMAVVTVTVFQDADGTDNGGDDHGDENNHDDTDDADIHGDSKCNPVEAADREYADDHGDDDCNKRPLTRSTSCVCY